MGKNSKEIISDEFKVAVSIAKELIESGKLKVIFKADCVPIFKTEEKDLEEGLVNKPLKQESFLEILVSEIGDLLLANLADALDSYISFRMHFEEKKDAKNEIKIQLTEKAKLIKESLVTNKIKSKYLLKKTR